MIPKIIHFCWFGKGKMPPLAEKCIASWKKYCPDYEIICWNEDNYDVSKNKYMFDAYKAKKWGFVPDFARLDIIFQFGGIYLDTDVELIKPIDNLLVENKAFAGVEIPGQIALGLGFGAEKNNPVIKLMLDQYEHLRFLNENGEMNLVPSPQIQTKLLREYGLSSDNELQVINDCFCVYPKDFFNPYNFENGKIEITENTYSIHHYAGSWASSRNKSNTRIYHFISRVFGEKFAKKLRKVLRRNK